jgi:hypothetical protein
MQTFFFIEVLLAALLFWITVILYARTPWYKSVAGRLLFAVTFNFALTLTLVVASSIFGDYPGRGIVRVFVFSSILFNAGAFCYTLVWAQTDGKPKDLFTRLIRRKGKVKDVHPDFLEESN